MLSAGKFFFSQSLVWLPDFINKFSLSHKFLLLLIPNISNSLQILTIFRYNHRRCSVRKGVPRNFAKFSGKHLCQSLFFTKAAGLRPVALLKKRLCHRCFPVNFAKFLRTPFLQKASGRLLLHIVMILKN